MRIVYYSVAESGAAAQPVDWSVRNLTVICPNPVASKKNILLVFRYISDWLKNAFSIFSSFIDFENLIDECIDNVHASNEVF